MSQEIQRLVEAFSKSPFFFAFVLPVMSSASLFVCLLAHYNQAFNTSVVRLYFFCILDIVVATHESP